MPSEEDLNPVHRRILELYREGWNPAAIAEEVDRPRPTVVNIASDLRKKGFDLPYGKTGGVRARGETVPPARGDGTARSHREAGGKPEGSLGKPEGSQREASDLSRDEVAVLREVVVWWKSLSDIGKPRLPISEASGKPEGSLGKPEGPVRKQTYQIEEVLIERLREAVEKTGARHSAIVNEALRRYLGE